jgi:hypothetical protein
MSQIDYQAMSDRELKKYFIVHRDDIKAFHSYMDRRQQKRREVLVAAGEIDHFPIEEQMKIVAERLTSKSNKKRAE